MGRELEAGKKVRGENRAERTKSGEDDSPILHVAPKYPGMHEQLKDCGMIGEQVPPLRQGPSAQKLQFAEEE